jgi:hypothetical protein
VNIHELQAEKLWSSSTNTDAIQVNCEYTRITSWKVVKQFYKYWRNTSKLWIYHELQAEKLWSSSTNTDEIQVNCEYTQITSWKVVK